MTVYYNDNDPFICQWLRELIADGLVPPGDMDERSIADVRADDLDGYTQCHFFAGIGGWPLALDLAGWPRDRLVWTASCPCQPFSSAGRRGGAGDERHLWPELFRLIAECRPPVVFGEQVASADGRGWLAGVRADLESLDYAVGAADLCAASVGAPHIRHRLWWVADAEGERSSPIAESSCNGVLQPDGSSATGRMADGDSDGCGAPRQGLASTEERDAEPCGTACFACGYPFDHDALGKYGCPNCHGDGLVYAEQCRSQGGERSERPGSKPGVVRAAGGSGWSDATLVPCADGKYRRIPVEPALFPLVDAGSVRNHVGTLRGAGNAIVPQVAAEFVAAYMEAQ